MTKETIASISSGREGGKREGTINIFEIDRWETYKEDCPIHGEEDIKAPIYGKRLASKTLSTQELDDWYDRKGPSIKQLAKIHLGYDTDH